MITFGNTGELGGSVRIMVYAPAGAGKTVLCGTAPAPLVISAENGLLSIKKDNVPFIEIYSLADFRDAHRFVTEAAEAKQFKTICIDSISDIAEVALTVLKKEVKDGRMAYGQLNDEMQAELIRWRHIPDKHIYITAKQERMVDGNTGISSYAPTMPGKQLPLHLPHWGDELFALRIITDDEGVSQRWLQTASDASYIAKDRSMKLDPFEAPNLTAIFDKINGV